jgi:hypothetical protein
MRCKVRLEYNISSMRSVFAHFWIACVSPLVCFYIRTWASLFLVGKYGYHHKPTQTGADIINFYRQHGPIWPKLEQHLVSGRHVTDILATFPAKLPLPLLPTTAAATAATTVIVATTTVVTATATVTTISTALASPLATPTALAPEMG